MVVVRTDTENGATVEIESSVISLGSSGPEAFNLPGLKNEIEGFKRGLFGGFSRFLDAAEEMANDLFNALNIPSFRTGESPSSSRAERQPEQDVPKKHDSLLLKLPGKSKRSNKIHDLNSYR